MRVKGARKLPSIDRFTSFGFLQPSTAIGNESETSIVGSGGPAGIDSYVKVTLGGHSGLVADLENEDLQHDYYPNGSNSASSSKNTQKKSYTARTRVCRRKINPTWDEEFRFEIADDTLLQDEPLIFRVLASVDTISSDESIGLVYVDLNPLLTLTATDADNDDDNDTSDNDKNDNENMKRKSNSNDTNDGNATINQTNSLSTITNNSSAKGKKKKSTRVLDGWFPLYDTMGGVRGELGLSIKLNFIGDVNPFRDSSAGVQLFPFSTLDPASGYEVLHVFGFVEELIVADDPEFEWKNNFRQARTSNETRQSLLYLLDFSVRRRMCKKVLEVCIVSIIHIQLHIFIHYFFKI